MTPLCWLRTKCSNFTILLVGRDFLARSFSTEVIERIMSLASNDLVKVVLAIPRLAIVLPSALFYYRSLQGVTQEIRSQNFSEGPEHNAEAFGLSVRTH